MKFILEWDWKHALYLFFKYYFLFLLTVLILRFFIGKPFSMLTPSSSLPKPYDNEASKMEVELFEGSSSVTVIPKQEAGLFLLEDADNYVQSMSKSDLHARKITCEEAYRLQGYYATLDPSSEQLSILQKACQEADNFFATFIVSNIQNSNRNVYIEDIKVIGYFDSEKAKNIPWNFILVKNDYEQGLPHTRDKYIIIHPSLLTRSLKEIVSTLIHEKVHVYQRKYRKEDSYIKAEETNGKLTDYMVSKMGFQKIKKRSDVSCDIRANPDIDEWIYKNPKTNKEMYLCYRSGQPTGIEDVIGESKEEHPYEYIAYEIAQLYEKRTT
jgi:hypothetical protein